MKPYWVSWYELIGVEFALFSPWWTYEPAEIDHREVIVAAILAHDDEDAIRRVFEAHDYDPEDPVAIQFRYVKEMPYGWTPFGRKRQRADWMLWPSKPH